jgi:hypothetical protein
LDPVINKFLIETDQYQPMLNTKTYGSQPQKVSVSTLKEMVAEREEKILNQVLDRRKIKQEVLLVDTVYDWYPKGV